MILIPTYYIRTLHAHWVIMIINLSVNVNWRCRTKFTRSSWYLKADLQLVRYNKRTFDLTDEKCDFIYHIATVQDAGVEERDRGLVMFRRNTALFLTFAICVTMVHSNKTTTKGKHNTTIDKHSEHSSTTEKHNTSFEQHMEPTTKRKSLIFSHYFKG